MAKVTEEKSLLYEKMRKFISTIDELRDYGLQSFISLPRIAVVGLQSAGKSSLLESIVGYDFLPRGEGIVTRRPLELRLIHAISAEEPYGVFDKHSPEKITDFQKIRQKIVELTDLDAGKNKGIINNPLILTIYSKNCPDLSLVDLPGITKIPVKDSGQPDNIEEITTDLVVNYISEKRTIILCTVQANIDITTSDAIKLARKYDIDGERTICALTKVDLTDIGANIRSILNNEEVALKYGYVAVKNRGPKEIADNVPVSKGLELENKFFRDKYPELIDQGLAGTKCLVDRLSLILSKNIQSSLPSIIKELREKIDEYEQELRSLGTPLPESNEEKIQVVLGLLTEFCNNYSTSLKGKYTKLKKSNEKEPVSVQVRRLLINVFKELEETKVDNLLSDKLIRAAFVNYSSSSLPGFPSFSVFQKLLQPLLNNMIPKSSELVDSVYFILEQTVQEIIDKIFMRLPDLKPTICELALKNVLRCRNNAEKMVDCLIKAELGYLYTADEQYLGLHGSILPIQHLNVNEDNKMSDAFVIEIRERVKNYFMIIYRNLRDTIPKSIGHILIGESYTKMQVELFEGVNKENSLITKSLEEPDIILNQRKQCQSALRILKSCLKKLQEEDLLLEDD